jgi:hypothetical protein
MSQYTALCIDATGKQWRVPDGNLLLVGAAIDASSAETLAIGQINAIGVQVNPVSVASGAGSFAANAGTTLDPNDFACSSGIAGTGAGAGSNFAAAAATATGSTSAAVNYGSLASGANAFAAGASTASGISAAAFGTGLASGRQAFAAGGANAQDQNDFACCEG